MCLSERDTCQSSAHEIKVARLTVASHNVRLVRAYPCLLAYRWKRRRAGG